MCIKPYLCQLCGHLEAGRRSHLDGELVVRGIELGTGVGHKLQVGVRKVRGLTYALRDLRPAFRHALHSGVRTCHSLWPVGADGKAKWLR